MMLASAHRVHLVAHVRHQTLKSLRVVYLKILKAQGPSAAGGAYSYLINGRMIGGFALVAYPAVYGSSGVMTFIVNQQGKVYQKNLGPGSDKIAQAMTIYNPDDSWERVTTESALTR